MIRYEAKQVRQGGKLQWRWLALNGRNGQKEANGVQAIYHFKRIVARLREVCHLPLGTIIKVRPLGKKAFDYSI